MEKHLRHSIRESSASELRVSSELLSVSEDDEWVYARYKKCDGSEARIRAKFLVGADGKKGFVRKMYLEPRGVKLERTHP